MRELFEHTADLGLRVRAPDLRTLFVEAAECLYTAIVENLDEVRPTQAVEFTIVGTEREYLLFDWLRELLMHSEEQHFLFSKFDVQLSETGLKASAWGEPMDRDRHDLSREVKAITYHELKVEPDGDGWLAEVIVDI
jgi:SHS2 domain-containing protein